MGSAGSMKSRNFTISEIAHRDLPSDKREIAAFQMGYMQAVRDFLITKFEHTHHNLSINITSGYRDEGYNKNISVSDKAKETSNHIWRLEDDYIRCANDFYVTGMSLELAYTALSWVKGEFYLNAKEKILHLGQQGNVIKEHWKQ